jgi:2-C-methyl-D-erythritol 4-phosphate cytidylyltransferase
MNYVAVIVAGGSGTRMGKELPKQFLELNGKPILIHSLQSFLKAYPGIRIVLVLPKEYIAMAQQLVAQQNIDGHIDFVEGGKTRFDSVKNGLMQVAETDDIIFVHDAVRCLVSPSLIKHCGDIAEIEGSAIPVVPVRDSMRRVDPMAESSTIVNRENLVIVQTPQTFKRELLLKAFEQAYDPMFTDEASVVEAAGYQVKLVKGEEANIKITFPEDLAYAEWKLSNRV